MKEIVKYNVIDVESKLNDERIINEKIYNIVKLMEINENYE